MILNQGMKLEGTNAIMIMRRRGEISFLWALLSTRDQGGSYDLMPQQTFSVWTGETEAPGYLG